MSKAKKAAYAEKEKAAAHNRTLTALGEPASPVSEKKSKPKKASRGK